MLNNLENATQSLNKFLDQKSLFYFARDPERALGLATVLENYHIIHVLKSQYISCFDKTGVNYFCLEDNNTVNTFPGGARILLKNPTVLEYLKSHNHKVNFAQTFKVSPAFVKNAQAQNLTIINSSTETTRTFEEKMTQYKELSAHVNFPKSIICRFDQMTFLQIVQSLGGKFVVQFERGHTGSGTHIIEVEDDFNKLQFENLQRTVKFSSYIEGHTYTLNACVTRVGVFIGGLNFQITGNTELGAGKGTTLGNDWSIRTNIESCNDILKQTEIIGSLMYKKGFRGMFGIDLVVTENGQIFIIEVNARQTASTPMYTKIQLLKEEIPLSMLHLLEFFDLDLQVKPKEYNKRNITPENYSQVFIRAQKEFRVNHQVDMGVYRLQGDNAAINRYTDEVAPTTIFLDEDRDKSLLFQKYAASVDFMDKQGVLVLAPVKERIIKKGEELARIQLKQSAVDNSGKLSPWIIESLNAIKYHQL